VDKKENDPALIQNQRQKTQAEDVTRVCGLRRLTSVLPTATDHAQRSGRPFLCRLSLGQQRKAAGCRPGPANLQLDVFS